MIYGEIAGGLLSSFSLYRWLVDHEKFMPDKLLHLAFYLSLCYILGFLFPEVGICLGLWNVYLFSRQKTDREILESWEEDLRRREDSVSEDYHKF